MRVLLLNTSDTAGGAARAAYRLYGGLRQTGLHTQMLVQDKSTSDKTVVGPKTQLVDGLASTRVTFDHLPLKFYPKRPKTPFSPHWVPENLATKVRQLNPDVINLHWLGRGFARLESLAQFQRPLIWSLHDMWAFTGGCYYSTGCDRYQDTCGQCPQLNSQKERDLSRWIWQRKHRAWQSADLTIVALSHWLGDCARTSSLFQNRRVEVIPNGIDTEVYRPIEQATARHLLGLPQDKKIVLFGSLAATSDSRKGFHLLQPALQTLHQTLDRPDFELAIFGASEPDHPPDFGFKAHYLGSFQDDLALALVYAAADVFVLPSTEENLANTVMEAIACGTPCVAFKIGGMPDMIEHQENGYLAEPFEIDDLAQGIAWVLADPDRHCQLSKRARQKTEQEFTLAIQAQRYTELFTELCS